MKRCFIAMTLPDETRRALARVQESLRALPPHAARRLRLTAPRNLHLTVMFLGATPDAQVPAIRDALAAAARRAQPTGAVLAGLGAFPSPSRPRAVFVAVTDGARAVDAIAVEIETALAPLGFAPEERTRVPHVTLARVEGAKHNGPLSAWLAAAPRATYGPLDASRVVLYESVLNPGGSIYTPLATFNLGA